MGAEHGRMKTLVQPAAPARAVEQEKGKERRSSLMCESVFGKANTKESKSLLSLALDREGWTVVAQSHGLLPFLFPAR